MNCGSLSLPCDELFRHCSMCPLVLPKHFQTDDRAVILTLFIALLESEVVCWQTTIADTITCAHILLLLYNTIFLCRKTPDIKHYKIMYNYPKNPGWGRSIPAPVIKVDPGFLQTKETTLTLICMIWHTNKVLWSKFFTNTQSIWYFVYCTEQLQSYLSLLKLAD